MELHKKTVLTPELLAEIKKLHFQTRHLADQTIGGQYRSAFKGRGIEFEEVREYSAGDEIRTIDWKVTARQQRPYIKSYREERELTVMLAVDTSGSTLTATRGELRASILAKIGAVLTFVALRNNDKVGLVTFSNKLETYHPPRKARSAAWRILHEVLQPPSNYASTDISALCHFLNSVLKRSSIIFLLSDFLTLDFEYSLAILAKRHDVTALIARDPIDNTLPNSGLIHLRDPETNQIYLIDSSDPTTRNAFAEHSLEHQKKLKLLFEKHKVGSIVVKTNQAFVPQIRQYFEQRKRTHAHSVSVGW